MQARPGPNLPVSRPRRARRARGHFAVLVPAIVAAALLGGCSNDAAQIHMNENQLESYVRVMMPRKVEIQRYLTKPVSFANSGNADGIEVIIAALDSVGDPTKVVGTFHFELHTVRMASADRYGERVAFWPVEINSDDTFLRYWDRLARFYRFPLKLEAQNLPPGRYILSARLQSPVGDTLFDEYDFTHEPGVVPTVRPGY